MSSTFTGLSIATRGLYTSMGSIMVASNNLSNANTKGYSRQEVNQSAVVTTNSYNGTAFNGAGSQINSIDRVRDTALDRKYWRVNNSSGEWKAKATSLKEMESVLSTTGFSKMLSNFYTTMENLSKDSGSDSVRTTVKESANSICKYLNDASKQLTQLREELNCNVKTVVNQINTYARQIADINGRIREAAVSGSSTNDLEDQRTVLLDKLSELTEIDVTESVDGQNAAGADIKTLSISVQGYSLVNGGNVQTLECYEVAGGGSQQGMYGIRWQGTNTDFSPGAGQLQACLELRDGDGTNASFKGVPYYLDQLNDFARTFSKAFNEGVYKDGNTYYKGHSGGVGSDGSTGIRFFSYNGLSSADLMASGADMDLVYANITAANISLSNDVKENVKKIAAASSSGQSGNNENIKDLISICKDARLFNKGTPEDFIGSIVSTMGSDSSYAQRITENYASLTKTVNDRRTSVSGVSTNEETANLTKYQQIYTASCNLVSTWNEIYEETINLLS
jgi:flagellar hook-associated protein 1 FlgK